MKRIDVKWLWLLGSLLVLNLALLIYLLLGNSKPPLRENHPLLEQILNFDASQTEQFEELRMAHHNKVSSKNEQIQTLKGSLFSKIENSNEEDDTAAIAQRIGKLTGEIDLLTRQHFQEIRKICNEEQRIAFDNFLKEILNGNRPQNPPALNGDRPQGPPPSGRPPMEGMPPPPR